MYPTLPYLPVIVKEISVHGACSSLLGEFDAMLEFFLIQHYSNARPLIDRSVM
jgi:hypothetical protein